MGNQKTVAGALPFLATALFFAIVFAVIPIFTTIRQSLYRVGIFTSEYVGLRNYIEMFGSRGFLRILVNSVVYVGILVPAVTIPALWVALRIDGLKNQGAIVGLFFLPSFTAGVVIGSLFRWIYHPLTGLINGTLREIGIKGPQWLGNRWTAILSVSAAIVYVGIAANVAILSSAVAAVPRVLREAAIIAGAKPRQVRWQIVAPVIRATIGLVVLLGVVGALLFWEITYVLAPARSAIHLMYSIYETAFEHARFGMGAAQATIMIGAVTIAWIIRGRR